MENNDYYSKWMNALTQERPASAEKTDDLYSKWMDLTKEETPEEIKIEKPGIINRILSTRIGAPNPYLEPNLSEPPSKMPVREVFTGKYWEKTGKNLITQMWDFARGMPEFLQQFTPTEMTSRLAEQTIAGTKALITGEKISKPETQGINPAKTMFDIVMWLPRFAKEFIADPIKTVQDKPLDVAFLMAGPLAKKLNIEIKPRVLSKLKAKTPLELEEIANLTNETSKVIPKIQLKRIGPEAEIVESLGKKVPKKMTIKMPARFTEEFLMTIPTEQISINPAEKLTAILKRIKEVPKLQKYIYSKEKGGRLKEAIEAGKAAGGGEAGFYAEKAKLKGTLSKIEYEPIRKFFGQTEIDELFRQVENHPILTEWEKISAREGLAKLFRPEGTAIPIQYEIGLLNQIFGREFTKTILSKLPTWEKIKRAIYEIINIPRSVMASYDLSGGLRQGIFLMGYKPKQFFSGFAKQFEYFGSEKAFKAAMEEIASRPTYKIMREAKIAFTEMDSILGLTEEKFMSHFAEKIPGVGLGVRASSRAYTGFLNKLRADVFDDLFSKAMRLGYDKDDPHLLRSLGSFINNATGRGTLGKLGGAAVALNSFLFSPRLMMSRLNLLNPIYYIKLHPFVRREALKSLFIFASMGTSILGLAGLAGAKIGLNSLSADFGKIRIGNTRIDMWGGFQQYVRSAAQLIAGKTVSSITGKETILGEGYRAPNRLTLLTRILEQKTSPVMSFAIELTKGQGPFGQELNIPKEVAQRFIPMVIQDSIDIALEDPKLLPLSALGIFGAGLQTYEPMGRGYIAK